MSTSGADHRSNFLKAWRCSLQREQYHGSDSSNCSRSTNFWKHCSISMPFLTWVLSSLAWATEGWSSARPSSASSTSHAPSSGTSSVRHLATGSAAKGAASSGTGRSSACAPMLFVTCSTKGGAAAAAAAAGALAGRRPRDGAAPRFKGKANRCSWQLPFHAHAGFPTTTIAPTDKSPSIGGAKRTAWRPSQTHADVFGQRLRRYRVKLHRECGHWRW
mmetsp:Transcript_1786/g.2752  ORF Transcript_1786/g.2752 Transcript_1786/m.2752 type:complete len:218 (+) Transcript_1786:625-1278(+)